MFKVLKYLGKSKAAVAAIIALLILQAYCDLELPQYTADIVDVGIGQGGIEYGVPERMRAETFDNVRIFMTAEEEEAMQASYAMDENGNYVLAEGADREALETEMALPMALLTLLSASEEISPKILRDMMESGAVSKEEILQYREMAAGEETKGTAEPDSGVEGLSDSMIAQMAVNSVKAEYEALGMDIESVQTRYLLDKGGRMLGLSVLMMAVSILAGLLSARISAKIGSDLRSSLFRQVVSFSDAEMDRFSTASLITRSTNDIQQIQMVSVMLLRMVLYAPIVGVGGVLKVIRTRTGMGWIILVAVAAIMLLVGILMLVAMPKFKKMQTLVDRMNLVSREILTGIMVIRAFSREKFEEKRFDRANKDLMGTQLFTNRVMTIMMPMMMLIMNGITVMIVWFGAKGVDLGNLQVGDMLAFITYTMQIVMAFLMITMISVMLPRAGVAAERIEEVLATRATIQDKEITRDGELNEAKGVLKFENVGFRYPGADEDALQGISFTANPGETTALICSTACGKKTMIRLIPRYSE